MPTKQNRNGRARRTGSQSTRGAQGTGSVSDLLRTGTQALKQVRQVVAAKAGEEAAEISQALRKRGGRLLAKQKDSAADEIGHIGAVIRQTADRLQLDEEGYLSRYVASAADGIDKVSQYLAGNDLPDLADDLRGAARRHPAWFVGGLMLAGLVAGRLIKAARPATSAAPRIRRRRRD